ncbi:MAG TPA: radical SAM protein [Planctomycetota bacterium]|nr:radical SAM protein [Planctomycetota bacterium]
MKVWVCMELRRTGPLGLPSRAGEILAGRTVLERAVARAGRTAGIAGVAVLAEPGLAAEARAWLGSARAEVLELGGPDIPGREAIRRSRKWAKDSWRGGLGQSMELDSAGDFAALAAAARRLGADAIVAALPEAVLLDPGILAGLVEHAAPQGTPAMAAAFCQAPGGFAGLLGTAAWLEAMGARGATVGRQLALTPAAPSQDPVHRQENFLAPTPVRRCEFRGSADSARSQEMLAGILRRAPGPDGLGPSAEEAAALVAADPELYAGRLPRIVDVELTAAGRVPVADTPWSREAPERRMDRALFGKLLADLAGCDDILLTLGGLGDPLAHPEVFDFLRLARGRGIYGLHLETFGPLLDEAAARRLLECDVDVVSVRLSAGRAETYRRLTGRDDFDRTVANVERLVALRRESGREWPFVVVEAEKRVEVEPELLDFFDFWNARSDGAVIRPASDCAGQLADRASVHLNLARRIGCRRLMKEMVVLADGTVPVCRMDFTAAGPAGNVREKSIEELWTGGRIAELRREHGGGKFDGFRLCPKCRDWDGI